MSGRCGIVIKRKTMERLKPVPAGGESNPKFYLDDTVRPMLAACMRLLATVRPSLRWTCHIECKCGWCMPLGFLYSLVLAVSSPHACRYSTFT